MVDDSACSQAQQLLLPRTNTNSMLSNLSVLLLSSDGLSSVVFAL